MWKNCEKEEKRQKRKDGEKGEKGEKEELIRTKFYHIYSTVWPKY